MKRRNLLNGMFAGAVLACSGARVMAQSNAQNDIALCYYSWYDNTDVSQINEARIDAVTGASLFAPGLVTQLARWIGEEINVTPNAIVAREPYPSDYDACLDLAIEQKLARTRPVLTETTLSAMAGVNGKRLLFLGFPNWSYTLPMPVMTFLEGLPKADLVIAPFCVHGTGGLARTIVDLRRAAPKARVLAPFSAERESVLSSEETVKRWASASMKEAFSS